MFLGLKEILAPRASRLKAIISEDLINAERKYKDSFDLQPSALVVLSSNLLWSPQDSSTGLQRRIIYIPVTTIPEKVDRDLFIYNLSTNKMSGKLVDSLPGLVNWALGNNDNNLNLLNNAIETNKLISPYTMDSTNPLLEWINNYITSEPNSEVNVGKINSDAKTNLFPHYLKFCKDYGHVPLKYNIFSTVLSQQLNNIFGPTVLKRRTRGGTVISNIKLHNDIIYNNTGITNINFSDIKSEFNGYISHHD